MVDLPERMPPIQAAPAALIRVEAAGTLAGSAEMAAMEAEVVVAAAARALLPLAGTVASAGAVLVAGVTPSEEEASSAAEVGPIRHHPLPPALAAVSARKTPTSRPVAAPPWAAPSSWKAAAA